MKRSGRGAGVRKTRLVETGPGVALEAAVWGDGEPVVFVQTGLTADESLLVAKDSALASGWRKILYHRRGYAGSSPRRGAGSIAGEAADCLSLMSILGMESAHIVGLSLSCAIALEAAAGRPERVLSLTLIEPPPTHAANAADFRAASERLVKLRRECGVAAALQDFLANVLGPEFLPRAEKALPGSGAQMQTDAATFFDSDIPALRGWHFGAEQASPIRCPILYVRGTASGALFAGVPAMIMSWLPHAEEAVIEGGTHSLALTHAPELATAIASFLRRGPPRLSVDRISQSTSRRYR